MPFGSSFDAMVRTFLNAGLNCKLEKKDTNWFYVWNSSSSGVQRLVTRLGATEQLGETMDGRPETELGKRDIHTWRREAGQKTFQREEKHTLGNKTNRGKRGAGEQATYYLVVASKWGAPSGTRPSLTIPGGGSDPLNNVGHLPNQTALVGK